MRAGRSTRRIKRLGVGTTAAGKAFAAVALATGVVWLAGCSEESPTEVVFEVIEDVTFDSSLNVDLSQMTELPSGVYIEDRVVGTGAVVDSANAVTIDHSGWLRDGTQFSGGVFSFEYLVDDLIEGFEIGMEGMAVGGTRLMVIPPELGYGAQGAPGAVPPGAIVIFEVELQSLS